MLIQGGWVAAKRCQLASSGFSHLYDHKLFVGLVGAGFGFLKPRRGATKLNTV